MKLCWFLGRVRIDSGVPLAATAFRHPLVFSNTAMIGVQAQVIGIEQTPSLPLCLVGIASEKDSLRVDHDSMRSLAQTARSPENPKTAPL